MKTSELMIGDLLYLNRRPVRVDAIGFNGSISYSEKGGFGSIGVDKFSPIPLTGEILVKNGFVKNDRGDFVIDDTIVIAKENYCPKNYYACTWYQEDFDDEIYYIGICELTFVHQLQHLLRLAGIDKEIEL